MNWDTVILRSELDRLRQDGGDPREIERLERVLMHLEAAITLLWEDRREPRTVPLPVAEA